MHIITEILVSVNLLDGPTFAVKLVKSTKFTNLFSFASVLYWQFKVDIGYVSGTPYKTEKSGINNYA